ncbi:MAG: phytoene desaturase family protein [Chloroflexota bacterium]|nr:phytoene desaturase family protein [Dehalococcoidia bacterium]MDW8252559.1 phytoene desaturase family protein [Chloroflexota bacterium]
MTKVLIIGGGIGGLALAIRLQCHGYRVTIVEQDERVGGRTNVIRDRGFTFDTGPTLLLMVDVLRELFAFAGRTLDDYVELVRLEPNYRIHFADGTHLDLTANLAAQIEELARFTDRPGERLLGYLADAAYKYRVARERFVERNFFSFAEFATVPNLVEVLKTNSLGSLYDHVGRYFDDERLKLAFTFQTMYLGISPHDAPAIYALLPYTELAEGIWYARGGMYRVVEALERLARELGVKIVTGCKVRAIHVADGLATGAETVHGIPLQADIVVSNVDLPTTYRDLLPPAARGSFSERKLDRFRYTSSAYLLYLGVSRTYDHLLHHNVVLSGDPKRNFDDIFVRNTVPADPSFYLHAPARTDPTIAPPGCEALYVLVPVPGEGPDWRIETPRLREQILDRLEAFGMPDLRQRIIVQHEMTPLDLARRFGLARGAAFGLGHDFWQVGWFRPDNKAERVDNLYFVGASTRPGTGIPMVMLSARLTAERIVRDWAADPAPPAPPQLTRVTAA